MEAKTVPEQQMACVTHQVLFPADSLPRRRGFVLCPEVRDHGVKLRNLYLNSSRRDYCAFPELMSKYPGLSVESAALAHARFLVETGRTIDCAGREAREVLGDWYDYLTQYGLPAFELDWYEDMDAIRARGRQLRDQLMSSTPREASVFPELKSLYNGPSVEDSALTHVKTLIETGREMDCAGREAREVLGDWYDYLVQFGLPAFEPEWYEDRESIQARGRQLRDQFFSIDQRGWCMFPELEALYGATGMSVEEAALSHVKNLLETGRATNCADCEAREVLGGEWHDYIIKYGLPALAREWYNDSVDAQQIDDLESTLATCLLLGKECDSMNAPDNPLELTHDPLTNEKDCPLLKSSGRQQDVSIDCADSSLPLHDQTMSTEEFLHKNEHLLFKSSPQHSPPVENMAVQFSPLQDQSMNTEECENESESLQASPESQYEGKSLQLTDGPCANENEFPLMISCNEPQDEDLQQSVNDGDSASERSASKASERGKEYHRKANQLRKKRAKSVWRDGFGAKIWTLKEIENEAIREGDRFSSRLGALNKEAALAELSQQHFRSDKMNLLDLRLRCRDYRDSCTFRAHYHVDLDSEIHENRGTWVCKKRIEHKCAARSTDSKSKARIADHAYEAKGLAPILVPELKVQPDTRTAILRVMLEPYLAKTPTGNFVARVKRAALDILRSQSSVDINQDDQELELDTKLSGCTKCQRMTAHKHGVCLTCNYGASVMSSGGSSISPAQVLPQIPVILTALQALGDSKSGGHTSGSPRMKGYENVRRLNRQANRTWV